MTRTGTQQRQDQARHGHPCAGGTGRGQAPEQRDQWGREGETVHRFLRIWLSLPCHGGKRSPRTVSDLSQPPCLLPAARPSALQRPLGDQHSVRMILHFCVFKTAKGIALGTVHLTGHGQPTRLHWASVPRDVIFLPCSHPATSSRTDPVEHCRKQRGGSSTSLREALPAQPAPRHRLAAIPPSKPLPARVGCALCSQLLLPRNNCEPHQPGGCFLV